MLVLILGVTVTLVTAVTQFALFGETLMSQHLMETKMIFMEMQFIFYRKQVKMQSTISESFFILGLFLTGKMDDENVQVII